MTQERVREVLNSIVDYTTKEMNTVEQVRFLLAAGFMSEELVEDLNYSEKDIEDYLDVIEKEEDDYTDFEIGVLLFHCSKYGRADSNIQNCVSKLFNALSSKLNKEEVEKGFKREAYNYLENEEEFLKLDSTENVLEIDSEAVTKLFEEMYGNFI